MGTVPLVSPTGANAQVVYSLTDSAEGHFSIEATTGVIRLEKPLRAKPQEALELTVRASDLGSPIPLSTLGTVTVSVVGLDDYLPVFLNTEHSVQVPEDAQLGTEVLQLATLTRPGAEKTGYRVVSGNEQGRFRLDARTGELAPEAASSPTCTCTQGLGEHWLLHILGAGQGAYRPSKVRTPLALSSLCISPCPKFLLPPWGQLIWGPSLFYHVPTWDPWRPSLLPQFVVSWSQLRPSPWKLRPLCPCLQRHEALAGWNLGMSSPGQGYLLPSSSPPQIS